MSRLGDIIAGVLLIYLLVGVFYIFGAIITHDRSPETMTLVLVWMVTAAPIAVISAARTIRHRP